MTELDIFFSFTINLCWSGKVHRLDLHPCVRELELLRRDGPCQGLDGQGHRGPSGPGGGQVDLRWVCVQPGLQLRLDQLGRQDPGLCGHDVWAHWRVKALRPAEDLVWTCWIFFLSSNHISAYMYETMSRCDGKIDGSPYSPKGEIFIDKWGSLRWLLVHSFWAVIWLFSFHFLISLSLFKQNPVIWLLIFTFQTMLLLAIKILLGVHFLKLP